VRRRFAFEEAALPKSKLPDWAVIQQRYVETDDTVESICADCGITEKQLATARKKHRWHRNKPRLVIPRRKPADDTAKAVAASPPAVTQEPSQPRLAKRKPAANTPDARRRLIDRLVAAISLKLEQLERRMHNDLDQTDDDQSATDHERETRAIGQLIDNLGKLTEMQTGHPPKSGAAARAAPDLAGEADRYRRELAERLRRIVGAHARKS